MTADRLFKEVLSRKDRADATRNALSVLTRFRFIFFLAESIDENMVKVSYYLLFLFPLFSILNISGRICDDFE